MAGSEGPPGAPRSSGHAAWEQHLTGPRQNPRPGRVPPDPGGTPGPGSHLSGPSAHARRTAPPAGLAHRALPAAPSFPPAAILHGKGPSPFCFHARLSPRRGPFPAMAQPGPLRRAPRARRGHRSAGREQRPSLPRDRSSAPRTRLRSPRPTRPGAVAAAPRDCAHRCPGGARPAEHFKASAKCTASLAGRRLINSRASSRLSHEYADRPRCKAGRHVTKELPPPHHLIGRDFLNINEPRRGAKVGARKQNSSAAPPPPPTWGRGAADSAHWLRARRRAGAPL